MPWYAGPNGQPVYAGDDGLVHVKDLGGQVQQMRPEEAAKLLSDERSGVTAASVDDLAHAHAQQQWDAATAGTKADFYAREGIKGAVDAVTAVPRAAFGVGQAIAKKLSGSAEQQRNPLEALSGESLVEKMDSVVGGDQAAREAADQARQFSEVAPGGKMVANAAGFLAGGAALKGAGLIGKALAGSELFGGGSRVARAAGLAAEGATQGYVAGAEDAWVKDTEYTSDAAMASLGAGALIGGGLGVATEGAGALVGAAKNKLAEKVFGKAPVSGQTAEAIGQMAEDVMGSKPPEGFAGKFKDVMEYVRDKVETAQSVASGVAKEDLEKFGGLRWDAEAMSGREAFVNRAANREAAAADLTEALQTMHTEGRTITDEVSRATGRKAENIKPLLTGDTETMMAAARDKAVALEQGLAKLDETTGRAGDRAVMGSGKQIEDIRSAMEDTIDKVGRATEPAEAVNALDEFKARMQRAKVNAESTSRRVTSGMEIEQARARASFANDVSEDMRKYLENEDIWGKFGDVQAKTNKAWTRVLDSDRYLSSHLFEKVGDDFGVPRYVADPRKIANYVRGLGTNDSKIVDGLLRDSIAAKRDLAESIVGGYGLEGHDPALQKLIGATTKAQETLSMADKNIASANVIEGMMGTAGSAREGARGAIVGGVLGGLPGAVAGMAMDTIMHPDKLMMQAVALRQAALKMTSKIDGGIKALVSGKSAIGRAAARVGDTAETVTRGVRQAAIRVAVSQQDQTKRYNTITKNIIANTNDPQTFSDRLANGLGHIDHSAVRDMMVTSSMRAASFLQSKIPAPVYAGTPLTPNQLSSVAPAEKAKFLRYYDAVNDPGSVFDKLKTGNVAPEQIEALKVCYPALYQRAQMAVFDAVHSTDTPMPYQTKIALAELFDDPGKIEPTLDRGFMDRVSAAAQQGGAAEEAKKQGAPTPRGKPMQSIGSSMKSNLDTLRI